MDMNYKAIIFDLGGVILNIDYNRTKVAFENLGLSNFDDLYSQAAQSRIFDRFEVGDISAQRFVNELLNYLPKGTTANQVVEAWNSMLLDLPKENLQLLSRLKQETRTFLLSNTNEIHVECFNRILRKNSAHNNLNPYFEKAYFSHILGKRKPEPETFLHLCRLHNLNVGETLFIDDSYQHIEGANKAGLITHHLKANESILDLF